MNLDLKSGFFHCNLLVFNSKFLNLKLIWTALTPDIKLLLNNSKGFHP
jgi:hypothetical protein